MTKDEGKKQVRSNWSAGAYGAYAEVTWIYTKGPLLCWFIATCFELCVSYDCRNCLQDASCSSLDTCLASRAIIVRTWHVKSGHAQITERMEFAQNLTS